jgi:hypothetical protein
MTLSRTTDGVSTVYVWFKDGKGNWSAAATDRITFDNPPTAPTVNWDLSAQSYCNLISSTGGLDFNVRDYIANDKDGRSTIQVVDAWYGTQHYDHNATTVTVYYSDTSSFGESNLVFSYKVRDTYGVTATGKVYYTIGPCS